MLQTLSQWCYDSGFGVVIRDSPWLFPVIEGVHLLGLALLGGSVLVVDLRLFDFGLRGQRVDEVERAVRPWMMGGLVATLVSGALMWASQAVGYYENLPFRLKMLALVGAIAFSVLVKPRLTGRSLSRTAQRLTATLSLGLWTAVGIAGRGIGFW